MMNRFPLLKPILKYSFIPGLILAIAGLVAGFLSKTWSPLYVGLLIGGSLLLLVWLIYLFISAQGFWQRRSTQAGTNALISTLSLVAILGLINFLVVRYSHPIDLTENQLFTLSTQSQEIVERLQQPVKVIIFDRQPNSTDKDLL
ncbi:MAG: ABC transporter, partial [Snowella sp.]